MIVCERGGGDWPPLAALARALIARGHRVAALCDRPIAGAFTEVGASTIVVPDSLASRSFVDRVLETDIAPRALRGEPEAAWPDPCAAWAEAVAPHVADAVRRVGPDVVVSSIFGLRLGLLLRNMLGAPMVGLNPSFYLGPSAPRPFAEDYPGFGGTWFFEQCLLPPLMASDVVLHATDREFDLDFDRLPPDHHYVGPLLWDPPGAAPAYMDEDGPPWILASLSTIQSPDETGLLHAMLDAVAGLPARVLITAPDHGSEAAGNLPDNVRLERFAPHGPALRKSALMLSHAGHGAVIKALGTACRWCWRRGTATSPASPIARGGSARRSSSRETS